MIWPKPIKQTTHQKHQENRRQKLEAADILLGNSGAKTTFNLAGNNFATYKKIIGMKNEQTKK
jgi:hypothetical protein